MARKTGLKGLQEWAKHVTQAYSNVEITNMTSSFRDGLAFCAIIHRYRPDLIGYCPRRLCYVISFVAEIASGIATMPYKPYNSLKKDDVLKNNQLAFSVADKELDIPALLDAEDMVALSVPDKLSVATYLVQYYNYFKDKAPSGPSVSKFIPPPSNPLMEPSPPTKRSKVEVETIGPSTVSPLPKLPRTTAATRPPPPILTTDKKTMSSPALQHQAPPTHKPFPLKSPPPFAAEAAPKGDTHNESSSKEDTPEPTEQSNKVKKGRRSKFKSQTHGTMGMEVCDACGERVFLMERLSVEGHIFHRACFKCYTCQCLLKSGSYEHDSKGDVFYCQPHYREALRQSTLKRTMQQRGLGNGDDTSTEVKRIKEEQKTSTTTSESSPGREITKDESLKIRAGLPGLLRSLAENKHEPDKTIDDNVTSSEDTSSVVKLSSTAEPTSSVPAKPPPPKAMAETSMSKFNDSLTKGRSKPPKPPVMPPRRPTWSPNVQSHDIPKRPAEPPKVPVGPPRRPTWSPKLPQYEPPKKSSTASTEASRVLTEAPNVLNKTSKFPTDAQRRPTWSPKIPAVEGERSKGELPKSTVAWITKGKVVDNESPSIASRHSTVSGIPAKPSPPLTTSKIQPKIVTIEEGKADVASKAGVASPPGGTTGPVKPPRRKKTTEKPHLPMAATSLETDKKLRPAPSPSPGALTTTTKIESVPKRHAPPRPSHQPSLKMRNRPEIDAYAACEQRHKKRLVELRRELKSLEQNQLKLEAKGIQLERQLRAKDIDLDDHLMEEWFTLVNEKNMLVRQESDLVYELRDLELIEQHDQLEKEIRRRVSKDDSLKSEMEKLEEEAMIAELVELVEKRDKLLWALHLEKGRDEEEDKQVELIASVTGYSLPKHLHRSKTHI